MSFGLSVPTLLSVAICGLSKSPIYWIKWNCYCCAIISLCPPASCGCTRAMPLCLSMLIAVIFHRKTWACHWLCCWYFCIWNVCTGGKPIILLMISVAYIVVSLWDFVLVLAEMPMCKLHLHFHFSKIITSKHSMKLKFLGDWNDMHECL